MVESRIAGHVLVEQLVALGADTVFCVPGESFLGVLDGLYEHAESIRVITNRQEGGTAMMASAYGQLTGRPGIAMVTRGPGATNAARSPRRSSRSGTRTGCPNMWPGPGGRP